MKKLCADGSCHIEVVFRLICKFKSFCEFKSFLPVAVYVSQNSCSFVCRA